MTAERIAELAKTVLLRMMRDISEDHYCAGWMTGLEYDLWRIAVNGGGKYGFKLVSPEDAREMMTLANECGGWWAWRGEGIDSGEQFVSLSEWIPEYDKWVGE